MPGITQSLIWPSNPHLAAPAKHRRACRYEAYTPDPLASLAIALPATVAGVVAEAESAIRDLNTVARPALAPFARLLLRTESIASSKVEGLHLGLRALARAEAKLEAGRRPNPVARDILGNIAAMETAVALAADAPEIGEAQILAIHRTLMTASAQAHIAGRLRTTQNWIGGNDFTPCGADFVPPPVDALPPLLHDLCEAINDDQLPTVVQAALVHAQFETLHPFDDGNGRTGRALVHVIFRRRGVAPHYVPPLSVVLAAGRARYIAGLTAFRGDDVIAWIEYFAAACMRAARLAQGYVRHVETLQNRWRDQLAAGANPRADAAAWALIDQLPAYPVLTATGALESTGRSRGPVFEALTQLESAGILVPITTSQRYRAWEPAGLLELLEDVTAGA